jgi:SGNH domain (fused to AT3 domains)
MRKTVASLALVLALAGCGKLGANAGTTEVAAKPGDDPIAKIQQVATEQAQQPGATADQVRALVKAAASIKKVPDDLVVPVSAATDDGPEAGWDGCLAEETASQVKDDCVYGDENGTKTVVLYGDSHAGMWESAFDVAGKRTHTKVVLLAKPACAVPTLHFWLETTQRQNTECDAWHDWATDKIVSLKPATVVLTSLYQGPRDFDKKDITEQQWAQGMTATITKVKTSGAKVVVLGDMPYLQQSAPECLAAHADDATACGRPADEAIFADHGAGEKATAKAAGATYVDTTPWFCSDVCEPIIGDMIVYQNEYHITAAYSRYLAGVVASAVGMA